MHAVLFDRVCSVTMFLSESAVQAEHQSGTARHSSSRSKQQSRSFMPLPPPPRRHRPPAAPGDHTRAHAAAASKKWVPKGLFGAGAIKNTDKAGRSKPRETPQGSIEAREPNKLPNKLPTETSPKPPAPQHVTQLPPYQESSRAPASYGNVRPSSPPNIGRLSVS